MNAKQTDALMNLYLLSTHSDLSSETFDYRINPPEEDDFNNHKSISSSILYLCIHSFLSEVKDYKYKPLLQSLYICFEDRLNDILLQHTAIDVSMYINKENMLKKRTIFITLNRKDKWSLIILENIHTLFIDAIIDKYYCSRKGQNNDEGNDIAFNTGKFRLTTISKDDIAINDIIAKIQKLFILLGIHNDDGTMLFDKDKASTEIVNSNHISLPESINEYETALVVLMLINGGIKSVSINLYLNSLLNTVFNSEYLAEVKINLFPKIQRILQVNSEKSQATHRSNKKNAIKEIRITYSAEKIKKWDNLIYRKTVVPMKCFNKPKFNQQNEECNDLNNYFTESNRSLGKDSPPRSTYSKDYKRQLKEVIDLSNYSSSNGNEIKEITLPLSCNHKSSSKIIPIYHHKNISNANMKYLQISAGNTSNISQPFGESSNNILDSTSTEISIVKKNTNCKKIKTAKCFDEELFIPNDHLPPKPKEPQAISNEIPNTTLNGSKKKKPTDKKRQVKTYAGIQDYSTYDPINEERNNHNEPCAKCGDNAICAIF